MFKDQTEGKFGHYTVYFSTQFPSDCVYVVKADVLLFACIISPVSQWDMHMSTR